MLSRGARQVFRGFSQQRFEVRECVFVRFEIGLYSASYSNFAPILSIISLILKRCRRRDVHNDNVTELRVFWYRLTALNQSSLVDPIRIE